MRQGRVIIGVLSSVVMFWKSVNDFLLAERLTGNLGGDPIRDSIASGAAVCTVMAVAVLGAAFMSGRLPGSAAVVYGLVAALLFRVGSTTVYIYAPVWAIIASALAVWALLAWRRRRVTPTSSPANGQTAHHPVSTSRSLHPSDTAE